MSTLTIILVSGLAAMAAGALVVLALSRVAARADMASNDCRSASPLRDAREFDGTLHDTVSVPSMPAWRWPGTEQ